MTIQWVRENKSLGGLEWIADGLLGVPSGMLGAAPYPVCRWFSGDPACTQWDQQPPDAQQAILAQANQLESGYNNQVAYYKSQGECDASKPGKLAGALKAYLIAQGGDSSKMDSDPDTFGSGECAEWWRVFNKAPVPLDAVKVAGGTQMTWAGKPFNITNICGSNITVPTCPAPGGGGGGGSEGGGGGGGVPCAAGSDCAPGQTCVGGYCVDCPGTQVRGGADNNTCVAAGATSKSNWGIVLLAAAAATALFFGIRAVAKG